MIGHDWETLAELDGGWAQRRHLIVAETPGPAGDVTARPLESGAGRRLAAYAGTTLEEVLARCDTTNIAPTSLFDRQERAGRAWAIQQRLARGVWGSVLIVGRVAADALSVPVMTCEFGIYAVPHTSGVNRVWNNAARRAEGERILRTWWAGVVDT